MIRYSEYVHWLNVLSNRHRDLPVFSLETEVEARDWLAHFENIMVRRFLAYLLVLLNIP